MRGKERDIILLQNRFDTDEENQKGLMRAKTSRGLFVKVGRSNGQVSRSENDLSPK